MADEAMEEAVERIQKCVKWSQGWAEANPDPVVADAVEDGLVTLGCLPRARLQRMLKREVLEPDTLTESQMKFLGDKGLLDPKEVETVDDDEEKADDGDDGGVTLDDLDEDERERLVEELREEIEEKMANDDDGAGGADVDEEPEAEEEPAEREAGAGLDDFREGADDDGDDEELLASEAM